VDIRLTGDIELAAAATVTPFTSIGENLKFAQLIAS
jgi:hypothetical protein